MSLRQLIAVRGVVKHVFTPIDSSQRHLKLTFTPVDSSQKYLKYIFSPLTTVNALFFLPPEKKKVLERRADV